MFFAGSDGELTLRMTANSKAFPNDWLEELGTLGTPADNVANLQRAVSILPEKHAMTPSVFSWLALSLYNRFQQTTSISDVNEAIRIMQKAISLAPDIHMEKALYIAQVGSFWESRFEQT